MGVVFWHPVIVIPIICAVFANIPDELHCRRGPESMGGACSISSDKCCESYSGNECRRELSQFEKYAAPSLSFYNNSLVFDPLMQLLCVKGLKVPDGNALRGKEIQGIYIEVELMEKGSIKRTYFSANTIVFPGLVFSEPMRKGLFCAELDIDVNEVLKDGMEFLVKMVSLPPDRNKHGVMHYLHKNSEFVPTKEVPRRSIHLKHCSNWSEHKIIEQPEPKICPNPTAPEPDITAESSNYTLGACLMIGCVFFAIGALLCHIAKRFSCRKGHQRSMPIGHLLTTENSREAENLEGNLLPKNIDDQTTEEIANSPAPEGYRVDVVTEIPPKAENAVMPNENNA